MDHERLGAITGNVIATRQPATAEAVASVLTTEELTEALRNRGVLVGEAATGRAMQETEAAEEANVKVPKPNAETEKRLEALSPEFREVVETRYKKKYEAFDGYIKKGILPEAYRLPPLGELMGYVEAAAPAYEAINALGGNAGFDFIPQGLSDEQKSQLAAGHTLPNGQKTTGAYNYNTGYEVTDPTDSARHEGLWGSAVMDVAESPAVRGISADGSKAVRGVDLKQAINKLKAFRSAIDLPKLRGKKGLSADELLVCQVSPDEDTKFGIQLGRLERGEQPLDPNTWTIGKENVKVGDAVSSVFSDFNPCDRGLCSCNGGRGNATDNAVVRLSARG